GGWRVAGWVEGGMGGTDLSIAQFGLMTHIAAAGDDTIGALAERLGLDQSTLSRNLRGLERAGLVEIAVVEKDLRRRAVWLTEAGARSLEAAIPVWRRAHEALSDLVELRDVQKIAAATTALATADGGGPVPPAAGPREMADGLRKVGVPEWPSVGAKVAHEFGIEDDLRRLDTQLLDDDLAQPRKDRIGVCFAAKALQLRDDKVAHMPYSQEFLRRFVRYFDAK